MASIRPASSYRLSLLRIISEDLSTQREGMLSQGFWALFVYRLSHPRMQCRIPIIRQTWWLANALGQKWIETIAGITLPETAVIGRRLRIEHYGGIIVHGSCRIGDDVLIRQGVTLGNRGKGDPQSAPVIGNGVDLGAGAKVIGGITVGDNAQIGANAVLTRDVPAGSIARGVPARVYSRG